MAIDFKQVIGSGVARGKSYDEIRRKLAETGNLSGDAIADLDLVMGKDKEPKAVEDIPFSATDKSKVRMTVENTEILKRRLTDYKNFIDEKGFSGSFFGAEDLGKADNLRGLIIADIKEAKQLGTLDTGLLDFAENLVGQKPEKSGLNQNLFGKASKRISAGIEQYIGELDKDSEKYRKMLGVTDQQPTENRQAIMEKFNKLHKFAEENPEDERSKRFMEDWNNNKFDLSTGRLKEEFKELTPFEKKEQELKQKFEQENALTPEEIEQISGENGIVDRVVKGETGLVANLTEDFVNLKNNIVQTGTDFANSFNEVKDATGSAIEALKSGDIGKFKVESERARAFSKLGTLEGLVGITGTLGKFVGDLAGTGLETADDATKNFVSSSFNSAVKTVVDELNQTEQGKAGLEALKAGAEQWNQFAEENPETAKDISNVMGVIEGASTIFGANLLKKGVTNVVEGTIDGVRKGGVATGEAISTTGEVLSTAGQKIRHPFKATGELVDSAHAKIIEKRISSAGNVPEGIKTAATKTGFDEKQAALISTMNPVDKEVAKRLVDLAEQASKDLRVVQRPTDIVGQNLIKKQKPIELLRTQFGKEVDEASKSLRGKTVDTTPLVSKVESVLDDLNIKRTDDGFNFEESVFKNVPTIQKQITNAFKDIDNLGGDAYKTHILKKSIDEIVDYGTTGEGLKGTAGATLKSLRREADTLLDSAFPDYNKANTKYSEIRDVLESSSDIFGKKGINEQKAGQAMRRIFSNASSRGDVMELLDKIDAVAKKYKVETGENLLDQALFTEILEDLYGTQATTSLQGEVKKAIGALDVLRDPVKGIPKAAAEGVETLTARTADARKEFIKQLLK